MTSGGMAGHLGVCVRVYLVFRAETQSVGGGFFLVLVVWLVERSSCALKKHHSKVPLLAPQMLQSCFDSRRNFNKIRGEDANRKPCNTRIPCSMVKLRNWRFKSEREFQGARPGCWHWTHRTQIPRIEVLAMDLPENAFQKHERVQVATIKPSNNMDFSATDTQTQLHARAKPDSSLIARLIDPHLHQTPSSKVAGRGAIRFKRVCWCCNSASKLLWKFKGQSALSHGTPLSKTNSSL